MSFSVVIVCVQLYINWFLWVLQAVVVIKYLFQFGFFSWNNNTDIETDPFWPPRIIGIEKKDGFVTADLILLLALFIHRSILKVGLSLMLNWFKVTECKIFLSRETCSWNKSRLIHILYLEIRIMEGCWCHLSRCGQSWGNYFSTHHSYPRGTVKGIMDWN